MQIKYRGCLANKERDYKIKEMRDEGVTIRQIGSIFGISHQRVHKIILQAEHNQSLGL